MNASTECGEAQTDPQAQRQVALEATYEIEGLLLLMQLAINKVLPEVNTDTAALYAVRGMLQRSKALNEVLMDYVSADCAGAELEERVRGFLPDAMKFGAH